MIVMILLESELINREAAFVNISRNMEENGFSLGGNWEYDHGYFDRNLDEEQKVWLRIPFTVTHGTFDAESPESDAVILLGQPFVLKHLYEDGLDEEATPRVAGSLIDQFQEPVDKDADVEVAWVSEAQQNLKRLESNFSV
jgi:hypothetical protein